MRLGTNESLELAFAPEAFVAAAIRLRQSRDKL